METEPAAQAVPEQNAVEGSKEDNVEQMEQVTGTKLVILLTSLALACLLLMLDTSVVSTLGVVLGPLIGGAFTTGYTWRWCFYLNLPLGSLVALPIILLHIPNEVKKESPMSVLRNIHRHLDLLGFVLFAPAIVQLLLALQFGGNQYAWNSSQVIGLFCGAGATFIVWMVWNYHKGMDALLPFPIIRRRVIWMSGVNYTFLMSTLFGASYFLPIYFQAVKGVSAVMSGVYLLATILPQLFSAVLGGVWCQYIGPTIFLALYNTIFDTTLGPQLREQAPNADAKAIIAAGATGFRKVVRPQDLHQVGGVSWLAAWGMGWKDIRVKKETPPDQSSDLTAGNGSEKENGGSADKA